jgi:MMPL family
MTMLDRIALAVYRRRRWVLGTAIAGALLAAVLGAGVSSRLSPYGANDPATQSVQATTRFQAAADRQLEPGVIALVHSGDVDTAAARAKVDAVARELTGQADVVAVRSYYNTHDPALVSFNRRETYLTVFFRPRPDKVIQQQAKRIEALFAGRSDVKLGGVGVANAQVNAQVSHDLAHAELRAFPFIFLLSLLFFRSAVAALLPPLLGGLAIVFTLLALRIVSAFVDMSVYALNLVTGLGLGLAIDYSLFMVSRYREEAAASGFGAEALRLTLQTPGRTDPVQLGHRHGGARGAGDVPRYGADTWATPSSTATSHAASTSPNSWSTRSTTTSLSTRRRQSSAVRHHRPSRTQPCSERPPLGPPNPRYVGPLGARVWLSAERDRRAVTRDQRVSAEREGFEPSSDRKTRTGFRDRRIQPLCHLSGGA